MKISSSNAELAAGHASWQRLQRRDSERAWIGTRRPDFDGWPAAPTRADISPAAQQAAAAPDPAQAAATALRHDPRMQLLRAMLWLVFGETTPDPLQPLQDPEPALDAAAPRPPAALELERASRAAAPPAQEPAWGWERHSEQTRVAYESLSFQAQGLVRTADGREIRFELQLQLSRLEIEHSQRSERLGALKDPLVLNFDGGAAELLGQRFDFDLDADGLRDSLPGLAAGSGFLVFDRNADGQVNDGSELFGARSGAGFAELAQLDADANGWIDEADPAWQGLSVWRPGSGLQPLSEAGVGALALAHAATPFALQGEGVALGQLRSTGLYLMEDGRAGTLQQLDLRV